MHENVKVFPVWNKNCSAADRLREIAVIADKYPERFDRLFIGWSGKNEDGKYYLNYALLGCDTLELLGLIEMLKAEVHRVASGESS